VPETNAIFENVKAKDQPDHPGDIKRLSMDCKATVNLGEYSRGGQTRGENQALDHDFGAEEKAVPCGIVDEDSGQLYLYFGQSYKTSDFMVDNLQTWWKSLPVAEQQGTQLIQLKIDNGPESSGIRTQFLNRMVAFADEIGKPIQLLYYPPYHSKYNPIERCWGILEQHWNGTLLRDLNTVLGWAQSMTWKGIHPIVHLNSQTYQKGVTLTKPEMREIERRLERNPELPKWDILIQPINR
jgi:Rhodopirellula transposase DDE domain